MGIMDFARKAFPGHKVSAELRELFSYAGRPISKEIETLDQMCEFTRDLMKLSEKDRWRIVQDEDVRLAMAAVLRRFDISDEGSLSSRMDRLCLAVRDVSLLPVDIAW